MKAVWDNVRALDVLDSMNFVKTGNYGVIGHSLGGHNAIFTAVFDQRIKVIVSSCGFDSFLDYYHGDPNNWNFQSGWCQNQYMPNLAEYQNRLQDIPFDFHELLGALAPRPVFLNSPLYDSNIQAQSVDQCVNAALPVYKLYGATKKLQVSHPAVEHYFPAAELQTGYRLLRDKL